MCAGKPPQCEADSWTGGRHVPGDEHLHQPAHAQHGSRQHLQRAPSHGCPGSQQAADCEALRDQHHHQPAGADTRVSESESETGERVKLQQKHKIRLSVSMSGFGLLFHYDCFVCIYYSDLHILFSDLKVRKPRLEH